MGGRSNLRNKRIAMANRSRSRRLRAILAKRSGEIETWKSIGEGTARALHESITETKIAQEHWENSMSQYIKVTGMLRYAAIFMALIMAAQIVFTICKVVDRNCPAPTTQTQTLELP